MLDNQIGSVFLINGKVKGIEIFNSNIAFLQYEEKLQEVIQPFTGGSVDYDLRGLEEQIDDARQSPSKSRHKYEANGRYLSFL